MQFDKDAVYIDIGRVNYTKKEHLDLPKKGDENEENGSDEESSSSSEEEDIDLDAPAGLLKSLQDVKDGVDQKMKYSSLRLFKGSKAVKAGEDDEKNGQATNKSQKRRPVDDAFELANSFRRRFDEGDVEHENSGSDSESSDDDSSKSERDDDDDSASDDDSRNSTTEEEDREDKLGYNEDESGSDSEEDEEMEGGKETWRTNIAQQAAMNYLRRDRSIANLQQLVYGGSSVTNSNLVSDEEENDLGKDGTDDDEDSDDEFFTLRNKSKQTSDSSKCEVGQLINDIQLGEIDSSRKIPSGDSGIAFGVEAWLEEGDNCLIESIRDKFVTGNWGGNGEDEEGEKFDDFEDLEAGEKYGPNGEVLEDSDDDDEATAGMSDAQLREFNAKKKAAQKSGFDDDYDESKKGNVEKPGDEQAENAYVEALKREKDARLKRNEEEFGIDGESGRLRFEGFRQGIYCRVRIDGIPAEFVESFDPTMPLVIGGLTPQETERGLVRCRFKKHRWHKKILKCNDPLVFSIGWRRFQSIPVFSTEDDNGRYRFLKYTPEHMHCQATFYGPQAPPNTGVSVISRLLFGIVTESSSRKLTIHLCFYFPYFRFWPSSGLLGTFQASASLQLVWSWNSTHPRRLSRN